MPTTGYSGTPLIKKLGIKPEMKVLLINEPRNYFELLEMNITAQLVTGSQAPDFIHLFVKDNGAFQDAMKKILILYKKNTSIITWVSWYKKSAGMATDMTEDVIRHFALKNNLVDVKVCAVSDVWSALKLVVPLAKR